VIESALLEYRGEALVVVARTVDVGVEDEDALYLDMEVDDVLATDRVGEAELGTIGRVGHQEELDVDLVAGLGQAQRGVHLPLGGAHLGAVQQAEALVDARPFGGGSLGRGGGGRIVDGRAAGARQSKTGE